MEPDRLFEGLPSAMRPSSGSPGGQPDANGKNPSSNVHHHEHHQNNAENASYNPPSLIPPRILPLLHDLAQQMVEAGNEQQLVKIYRSVSVSLILYDPEYFRSLFLFGDSSPKVEMVSYGKKTSSCLEKLYSCLV